MRGVAALALTMSLAVAGACGAGTTEEKASVVKDQSPGRPARAASPTAAGSGGRGGMPQGSEPVKLDPADFSVSIDNPYWPMSPGTKWVYSETDTKGTNQKVVVEVTDETKMMANGIEARVVRDTVTENGAPVEITDDWYAQDKAAIITIGEERVQVPLGYFDKDVLMTRDLVPTEPKVQELKFYAPNVGPLLSMHTDGDGSRAELISYSRDG